MESRKLFNIPNEVTPENFEATMHQAIALELATIPTYLSTYYSIIRIQDADTLCMNILKDLGGKSKKLAEELALDVLVYSNKSAALIMSVVIEEMLHLALSSNVKQAICQSPPDLMGITKGISFPTQLDGHEPEFPINIDKLSLKQLAIFLQIESPNAFKEGTPEKDNEVVKYQTIGAFYDMIIAAIHKYYPGPYAALPQLLPDQPFYGQNSINTVYYDRNHIPRFTSADDSGGLLGVTNAATAVEALNEIIHQGEGRLVQNEGYDKLAFENGMPVPLPVSADGKVHYQDGDYDDKDEKELSHFDKFMEAYSLGAFYEEKFKKSGLDFFSYFVHDQLANSKQEDYDKPETKELALISRLGNAIFTYIILMVETCYYKDESTQFKVFMYGIHKSMIWLLSAFGAKISKESFDKDGTTYQGALSFEYYDFGAIQASPKQQIIELAEELATFDHAAPGLTVGRGTRKGWSWLIEDKSFLYALPDVGLDHSVVPDMPAIPAPSH